ncbi:MAG: DNA recombination protein RmuC [Nocardioides sp.]
MEILLLLIGLVVGALAGALAGVLWSRTRPVGAPLVEALQERAAGDAVIREGLERLGDQMRDLGHDRATWQGQFNEQVAAMRHTTDTLRRETQSLSTALRKPQVRGRWGEMHLRRAVELAGLVDRCDFTEQAQLDGGALRPDLVVRLAGDKSVVVDAKVPLDAFLDATGTDDDDVRTDHLERHARQLRTHVDQLSAKRYWRALPESPEFVVLFVPGEAFLSAALEADRGLLEHAAQRRVIVATPTTLIALLRTVAHGWSHEALADQAREIHRLGRELHERLARMSGHLDQVGRSLNATVGHYNQAVGSLESRVLVSARKFAEMGVTDDELPAPRQVETTGRSVGAADPVRTELHAADPPVDADEELLLDLDPGEDGLSGSARRTRGA